MTPFQKVVHRLAEAVAGTRREGATVPARFAEFVDEFSREHPKATRRTWGDFALSLASEAYRDGFRRGFEHSERLPDDQQWSRLPPELMADEMDPGWRHPSRAVRAPGFENPLDLVEDGPEAPELDERGMGLLREERFP